MACWKLYSNKTRWHGHFYKPEGLPSWVGVSCSLRLCCLLFTFCTGMNWPSAEDTAEEDLSLCALQDGQQRKLLSPGFQENLYHHTAMLEAFHRKRDVPPRFSSTRYTYHTQQSGKEEKRISHRFYFLSLGFSLPEPFGCIWHTSPGVPYHPLQSCPK